MSIEYGNTEQATFINIVGNKLTIRSSENTEGAVKRVLTKGPSEGKEVWELHPRKISGYIIGGGIIDKEKLGHQISIELIDGDEKMILQIPFESFSFRNAFLKRLPNIKVDEKVSFSTFEQKDGNFVRGVLYLEQGGENVPFAYTKDNPNGLPGPTEKKDKGKDVLVWEDQENFLYNLGLEFFDQFENKENTSNQTGTTSNSKVDIDDDVPF